MDRSEIAAQVKHSAELDGGNITPELEKDLNEIVAGSITPEGAIKRALNEYEAHGGHSVPEQKIV